MSPCPDSRSRPQVHLRRAAGNREPPAGANAAAAKNRHHSRNRSGLAGQPADRRRLHRLPDDSALSGVHRRGPRGPADLRIPEGRAGDVHAGPVPLLRGIPAGQGESRSKVFRPDISLLHHGVFFGTLSSLHLGDP